MDKELYIMKNIPDVKLGVIAVSRDCFVISLSERRRQAPCFMQPLRKKAETI